MVPNEDLIENLTEEQLKAMALAKAEEAANALLSEGKDDDEDEDESEDDESEDDEDEDEEDLDESKVVDEESFKNFQKAVGKKEKSLKKAQDKKDDKKAAKFQKQVKEGKEFINAYTAIIAEGTEQASAGKLAVIVSKFVLDKSDVPDSSDFKKKFDKWIDSLDYDLDGLGKGEIYNAVKASFKSYSEAKEDDDEDDSDDDEEDDKGKKGGKDAEDDSDDEEEEVEESINIQEDIRLLCESEANLTPEFKEKASIIVEAAVTSRVKAARAELQEEFDRNLAESVAAAETTLAEQIDGYLTHAVEVWLNENKVAVDSGLRSEIAESFIGGLKNLFNEHYMEVPAAKADLFESVESERDALKLQLEAKEQEASVLLEEVSVIRRDSILAEESESLADTQKEKLVELCEGVEYVSEAVWRKKVTTIRDTYFGAKKPVTESTQNQNPTTDSTELIVEGAENYAPQPSLVNDVLAALKRTAAK